MLVSRIDAIKKRFAAFVQEKYNYSLTQLVVEQPPKVELGDLAFPFCFELAKPLRKAPRQLAAEIVHSIGPLPGISRMEVAGPGYINLFFQREQFFQQLFSHSTVLRREQKSPALQEVVQPREKIILEHTNINPNKAAHIGHLRNAVLGDTFARLLRFSGNRVEVQNYIDDTGVQVADVVVGFKYLAKLGLDEVKALPGKFDYYCWDLYARVSSFYEAEENSKLRGETLQQIEQGNNETAELARYVAYRIVGCHLETMGRLGIEYDLLPKESDILHLKFWNYAFELLKKNGAIHYETEGKSKGCWIMRLAENDGASAAEPGTDKDYEEDKIIVRSNGTVTYVGKDIAYQLWKFGLLGMDFFYHPFHRYCSGHTLYMTNAEANQEIDNPQYGGGGQVYNVIDSRQSYLQNIVVQGLHALGFTEQADKSIHFSYEMVALSPRCCEELGIQLSEEDQKRPYVEVSGRKGLGVKADDLIDTLIQKSLEEVQSRHPELTLEDARAIATDIAVSALRYFLLKYTRNSVIAFDFKEALSFEGETGPYVQYSVVRANNIFRKVEADDASSTPANTAKFMEEGWVSFSAGSPIDDEFWRLIHLASQLESNVQISLQTAEPALVAKYLFTLAQSFNMFYHRHRIIVESDPGRKRFLLALTCIVRNQLELGLKLLGISTPEMM